ncbi:MAG: isoprenylcysteine carboxylmethyltransferase family protein [Candidatus Neomarinimicrobiota bacterium]|nr:MAG: isoprenylcysteine carboxylmethyltransferase family protein [Candidatus Neomarinimicrobiota bacterium]
MSTTLMIAVFVILSTVLIAVSRRSLTDVRSHGFFRFFAWEGILVLALLNARVWFRQPFSLHQIVSWILLLLSIIMAIHGFRLLKVIGAPDPEREDATLIPFEKTRRLVTAGAYRWIRHPLYASLLFLAWGIFWKQPSGPGVAVALFTTVFLYLTGRAEEKENMAYFGEEYVTYMKTTRMFIPWIF